MIKEQNGITVEYNDQPVYAFNPMLIKIDGWKGNVLMRYVSAGNTYEETRTSFGEHTEFNPMKYAQASFTLENAFSLDGEITANNGLMCRADVTLAFNDRNSSQEITLFMFVVYGAHDCMDAPYYPYYYPEEYYSNLPCSIGWSNLVNETLTVNGVDYKRTEKGGYNIITKGYVGDLEINGHILKENTCTDGVYLRWIDRHGFPRYKLFKKGTTKTKYSSGTTFTRVDDWNVNSYAVSKKKETEISCCAPLVGRDEFVNLGSVMSSPMVQMYSDGEWFPVLVSDATTEDKGMELQDFELTVKYVSNCNVSI